MLDKNARTRLTIAEVMCHPIFARVDWDAVRRHPVREVAREEVFKGVLVEDLEFVRPIYSPRLSNGHTESHMPPRSRPHLLLSPEELTTSGVPSHTRGSGTPGLRFNPSLREDEGWRDN